MDYDKTKFVARPPKSPRVLPCGCIQKEDVDEKAGYFIWVTITPCEIHKHYEQKK